jgi:hypothetical protein
MYLCFIYLPIYLLYPTDITPVFSLLGWYRIFLTGSQLNVASGAVCTFFLVTFTGYKE